jgi:nicotinamidase-related amidase
MNTCLLVIDVQDSFTQQPFFTHTGLAAYLDAQNQLIQEAVRAGLPAVRVLHHNNIDDPTHPFAPSSGWVRPLPGLTPFAAALEVRKSRHSALVDTVLPTWLAQHGISRLVISGIRTEQCCETTARHASDLGWAVDFVLEATHTWDMVQPDGQPLRAAEIKQRTATVLQERFAQICSVEQALQRATQAN